MYNYIYSDNDNNNWARIDKRKARGLFNKGVSIAICPDNLRPFGFFQPEAIISLEYPNIGDFDKICNEFEIYHCINRETGYHAAFYMEVE